MNVRWVKCKGGLWCPFERLNLRTVEGYGVYVIWLDWSNQGRPMRSVVRVGSGTIAERIRAHRSDREITTFSISGTLYVTWTIAASADAPGIERYVATSYEPLVGMKFPDVGIISVNLPF